MPLSCLYVVSTPIGNLKDITARAIETLEQVDLVAAEDTRHSGQLLNHLGISTPLRSVHDHNEAARIPELLAMLEKGKSIALISDAGTPLISDPGYKLVNAAIEAGIDVVPVPGPCAITAALSVAGLATDRFYFEGFLPAKSKARDERLQALSGRPETLVFYESNHRIIAMLQSLISVVGPHRHAAICRELTKRFETVLRGSLAQILEETQINSQYKKGEFVVLLSGNPDPEVRVDGIELARALKNELSASQAARVAARVSGGSRREIFNALDDEN